METFSALLALCAGNSPVTSEFPSQRPVTWNFDVFFHLCLNKRLSKQWWGWWFEMPLRSLWRRCNDHKLLATEARVPYCHQSIAPYCDHHWTQCRHAISDTGHVTQIRILEDPRWPPKRCWQDVRQGYLTVVRPWCWKGSDLMCRHSVIFSISLSVGFLDSLHDPWAYVARSS